MKTAVEELVAQQTETTRLICPECGPRRKKHYKEKTLSVTVNPHETLYKCHHCEAAGIVTPEKVTVPIRRLKPAPKPAPAAPINNDEAVIKNFFSGRGVNLDDVSLEKIPPIAVDTKYFHNIGESLAIGFVYGNPNHPDAVKWRCLKDKRWTQDGAARDFYGVEYLEEGAKEIIIVEGEADVIALASIGITAISVPNGAPMKVSSGRITPEEDKKFQYVWNARHVFDAAEKVILACDADKAGEALTEELARRLGRGYCYVPSYPQDCKDVTDVLQKHGEARTREVLEASKPMPLVGVYAAKDYHSQVREVYQQGLSKGESTGFENVDELWTIQERQLTVITGLPSSGKSEFVDAVSMNLAKNSDWRFAVASFENPPHIHCTKLIEKYIGKPFGAGPAPRLNESDLFKAMEFIQDHYIFLENKDGSMCTMDSILDRTRQALMRWGSSLRALIIDPYNYIDIHSEGDNEHQAINKMLTKVTAFAKANDIHIFFVAHPAKLYPRDDGTYPVPTGMNVSGSSAWFSKTDCGITVHRCGGNLVDIHSWKCRFKWIGQQGRTTLEFDRLTGRYYVPEPEEEIDLDEFVI